MTKYAVLILAGMFIGWNTTEPKIASWAQEWATETAREMLQPKNSPTVRYDRG